MAPRPHGDLSASRHPLWAFSCTVYGWPGVAATLLELQDRFGLDVNVLLAALWSADRGRVWSPQEVARFELGSAEARREVARLRARRRATSRATATYATLLEEELAAEARVQDVMYVVLRTSGAPALADSFEARAAACLEVAVADTAVDAACREVLQRLVQEIARGRGEAPSP